MPIDILEMAYLEALIQAELDEQKGILQARNYHKGVQTVHLTQRAKEFLELHTNIKFRLNVCQVIVTAVLDELNVIGFDTDEPADKTNRKASAEWALKIWQKNRMDAMQNDIHEATLRDREAFVIVDWDAENKRPRLTFHERYISTEAGGDGTGVWMLYENDDLNQPARAAVKQWTETIAENGQRESRMRRTVYYPDRIERFYYDTGTWKHYEEDGKPWPTPWTRNGKLSGKPIGLPVIHFKNQGYAPEAWEALPMQDAINKLIVDILGAADLAGFPVMVALGFIPTTDGKEPKEDGSNVMKIAPMRWVGTTKTKNDADVFKIEGSNIEPLMNTLLDTIALVAQITGTPISRFVMTRQLAGAETVKEQDKPLQRKAEKRRVLFGNSWEDALSIARVLDNLYGRAGLGESVQFSTLWRHSVSLDELKDKREVLNIPLEQLWKEAGYTAEQIETMKKSEEYRLLVDKALYDVIAAAEQAGISLETVLRRAGISNEEFGLIGTERLAAIKSDQEDVVPPVEQ